MASKSSTQIKAELFDLLRLQSAHQQEIQNIENKKTERMKELATVEAAEKTARDSAAE